MQSQNVPNVLFLLIIIIILDQFDNTRFRGAMCEAARRGKLQLVLNVKLIHGSHIGMLYLGRSGYMVQVAKLSKEIFAENRHDLLQQINGLRDRFVFQTFSVLDMP